MDKLIHCPLSRRNFLRGSGVLLALPLLESIGAKKAWAQAPTKRLVVVGHGQGTFTNLWRPTGSRTNWQLSHLLQPLAPFKSKLCVVGGLNNETAWLNTQSNGHNSPGTTIFTCMPFHDNIDRNGRLIIHCDTTGNDETCQPRQVAYGAAGGPSFDQVVANRIGANSRYPALRFAVAWDGFGENRYFHSAANEVASVYNNPIHALNQIFVNLPDDNPGPVSLLDKIRSQRGSVLDAVYENLQSVRNRVSAADRRTLETHAERIRDIEQRLGSVTPPPSVGCTRPVLNLPPEFSQEPRSESWSHVAAPAFIDLMVMALQCNLTPVTTLQFADYDAPRFSFLNGVNIPLQSYTGWHDMIHKVTQPNTANDLSSDPRLVNGDHTLGYKRWTITQAFLWYSEQVAYLLQRMNEVDEGGASLLDNSLVVWGSEFSSGYGHDPRDLPFVLAGGLGGVINTNQYLDFRDANRTNNDLYTAILNAFGGSDANFGWRDTSNGPLQEILA